MGASDIQEVLPFCSEAELRSAFRKLRDNAEIEYGTDPYNGSWSTIRSLEIHSHKTFTSEHEAHVYCIDKAVKWDFAVAVVLERRELSDAQKKRVSSAEDAWSAAQDKCKQLEREHTARFSTYLVERAKSRKSALKACAECDSKIAVKHLQHHLCPVCGSEGFLRTRSDLEDMEVGQRRLEAARTKVAELQTRASEVERLETAKAPVAQKFWLIAGWAAS